MIPDEVIKVDRNYRYSALIVALEVSKINTRGVGSVISTDSVLEDANKYYQFLLGNTDSEDVQESKD